MEGIDYVSRIESARVYDVARVTALDRARRLSDRLGANIYLKREDTQDVHSFKIRGAYQKMSGLSAAELAKGVLAASAGNHAQGVALSAKVLGTKATIVMPETTPRIKSDEVASYGAEIVLKGETYSDAAFARLKDEVLADGRVDLAEAQLILTLLDESFTPSEPLANLMRLLRTAVGNGSVSEGQSREIARALGETLNLQMTTAEERRRFMY